MYSDILFIILTFCCIAWLSWIFISNLKRAHPPLPPGPLGLPVVGSLPFLDPELHTYFTNLAKTYGPIFSLRLGMKLGIVVSSPCIAKEILKDLDVIFANHGMTAAIKEGSYGGSDIVYTPYGVEWRMLRKVFVRAMLSSTTLDGMYRHRKHEIQQTMKYLKDQSGTVVNIGDQMFVMAMNVITTMLWGGTVKGEERAKLGDKFRSMTREYVNLVGAPNVTDFFPGIARFDLQGIVKKMKLCSKKFNDIFEEEINRRNKTESVEDEKDALQVLLELKDSTRDSKFPLKIGDIKAMMIMDMFIAGTDTTSNTLEFAMAKIVNNPQVMRKARQELETVIGSCNTPLEEYHISRLPYLQAILKETMRLHPVVPLLIPHTPSEACIVGGYTIPKGSKVFINVWAIHRDPSLWQNPLEFKPERFLEGRYDFKGNDFTYFPFGSGRRICAGIPLAEKMLLYPLACLLHYFDWKLPEGTEKVDLDDKFGIILKKRTSLLLTPSPRSFNLDKFISSGMDINLN